MQVFVLTPNCFQRFSQRNAIHASEHVSEERIFLSDIGLIAVC